MDKLSMETPNLTLENVEKIEKLFPNCVKEAEDEEGNRIKKVDFDLLRAELGDKASVEGLDERYRLDWPGKKSSILKANTPITKTLRPVKEDSVDWDNTQNLYIEGDNFEVLKILQESYLGKIKMIYIDPPYNTGKDFIYSDNFSESNEEYKERTEEDDEGYKMIRNTESNGRFHSDWLSMMYERLKIARDLLKDEGVIFLSINDSEADNLKKILDEIFGEGNFIAKLVWTNNEGGGSSDSKFFKIKHEYILCYAKNISFTTEVKNVDIEDVDRYKLSDEYEKERGKYQLVKLASASLQYSVSLDYPIEDPDGNTIYPKDNTDKDRAIRRRGKDKLERGKQNGFIEWKQDKTGVRQLYTKQYTNCDKDGNIVKRTKIPLGLIDRYSSTQGSNELFNLFGCRTFGYPKPTQLLNYLIDRFGYEKDDIILDFFSGSATTAHSCMNLNAEDGGNRKYIMIQLPELCDEDSEAYKNGYKTICEIGKERIRRAGKKIKEEMGADIDYGFRVYRVDESCMKDVYYHPSEAKQENLALFTSNIKEDRTPEDLLTQVILNFGLTLDLPIEEKTIGNNKVFYVAGNSLIACFDENIDDNVIDEIAEDEPIKLVFRDACFKNDAQRINVENKVKRVSPETIIKVI